MNYHIVKGMGKYSGSGICAKEIESVDMEQKKTVSRSGLVIEILENKLFYDRQLQVRQTNQNHRFRRWF